MTFINHDKDARTLLISPGGNDASDGDELPINLATFEVMMTRVDLLDPVPDQNNQAGALSLTRGRYTPSVDVTFLDWTQVFMPVVTLSGMSVSRQSGNTNVMVANSFQGVEILGLTATTGQIAYLFDGTQRNGLDAKAITCIGGVAGIKVTNLAADSFASVGQLQTTSDGVYIDTKGTSPTVVNINLVELLADNARAFYVDGNGGASISMKGNVIRYGAGVTTGKAIEINAGDNVDFSYDRVQGDMDINGGESIIKIGHYTGDISVDASTSMDIEDFHGDISVTIGENHFDINHIHGNCSISGGNNKIDIDLIDNDFTVGVGATVSGIINCVTGNIVINGVFNGIINGVQYGTWIDNNEYLATFYRTGNISSSFDAMGRLVMNGDTDTVDSIIVTYLQGTANSRTVDLQIVDAETGLIVYFTATNTETSAGTHEIIVFTLVTPLPSGDINLEMQIKDNGSQVSDASLNIYFTRTP